MIDRPSLMFTSAVSARSVGPRVLAMANAWSAWLCVCVSVGGGVCVCVCVGVCVRVDDGAVPMFGCLCGRSALQDQPKGFTMGISLIYYFVLLRSIHQTYWVP